ncbi:MAG TPA: OmpA family protein [Thermoanaerobaculia bacterium]|nr:OmpA family protein [Thermoanaerobaculia bacterium]
MRTRSIAMLGLASFVAATGFAGQQRNPDSPETQAAATAGLSKAKVLDITGMTTGIQGALRDLNAKVIGQEIHIELSADVLFDFDSATLRPAASGKLAEVAAVLKEYPKSPVSIEGHTDGKGTESYNQALSERRADSVKKWLVDSGGIVPSRIATRGWGKTKPVAPNTKPDGSDDPQGRQKNRRVEITVRNAA